MRAVNLPYVAIDPGHEYQFGVYIRRHRIAHSQQMDVS